MSGQGFCGNSRLWDLDLLLNSSWPRFTECFQSSFLVFVPNGLLWASMLVYLPWVLSLPSGPSLPHSPASVAKTVLSLMLTVCTLAAILTEVGFNTDSPPYPTAHYVARLVEGVTYLLTAGVTQLERCRGVITSGVLFVYWLLLAVIDVIPMYHYFMLRTMEDDVGRVVIFLVSYVLILAQLGLQALCADVPRDYVPGACPETTATFLSRVTFWWMTRLITSGFRKSLEAGDLWRLNPRDESATVVPRFERALERAKARNRTQIPDKAEMISTESGERYVSLGGQNNNHDDSEESVSVKERTPLLGSDSRTSYSSAGGKKRSLYRRRHPEERVGPEFSLMRVMIRNYCGDVLLSYLCKLCSDVLQYLGPVLLSLLIGVIQGDDEQEWKGYIIALMMLTASWTQTAFYHQHYHVAMTTGMRMKTTLMAAIYKKSLKLSTEGQRTGTVGEVVNMMAVDCQRVQDMMSYTWMVWSIPLQVIIAVYLLWDTLGVSVLAGVGLLVFLVPVNGYLAFRQQKLQKENLQWKDKRIKIMNEIISGIKVLKLYAWETSFQDKVMAIRKRELGILGKVAHLNAFSIFIWTCAPYLVTLATFATYVLSDSEARLDANKAFVTLALFNILQFPIAFVPEAIAFTAQASVSIKRIEQFLKLDELDNDAVTRTAITDFAVRIERGIFNWDVRGRSTLHGINLEVSEGELVAVVGSVGSGKSSLLAAILGEIDCRQGKVVVKGNVAYVPQQAWIQNDSVRNNILFGKDMDSRKYRKVLDACALAPDLAILPGEDQTEIGEKGINLSGGQKQRVSLARAVYADADLYLLDDPLSAVDSQVGKHIFRRVISDKGMLKRKTRILVTHAVHWLPVVDTVVLLQEGRVVEAGSYMQLMRRNGALAQYLHNVLSASEDTDNEDDPEVLEMRRRILEHVESVTSTSEGGTSGDETGFKRGNGFLDSQEVSKSSPPSSPDAETATRPSPLAAHLTEDEQAATGRRRMVSRESTLVETARTQNPGLAFALMMLQLLYASTWVKMKVFGSYARHVGWLACVAILLLFSGYQVSSVYASFWLTDWTSDPVLTGPNSTAADVQGRTRFYLTYYGVLGAIQAVCVSLYAWIAAVRMTKAAGKMHATMLDRVFRAPMSFFDTTPSGRIVNRFARDVETIDNTLPQIVFMFVMCVFSVLSTLVVISITTPLFISVILPLAIGYYAVQRFFVPSSRQLKRLEAVTRSPIFSHFSETLSGACVIRAYRATERFIRESLQKIDKNQVFYFAGITANRWLGVWIEVVSSLIVFAAAIFALITPAVTSSQTGLSVTYALQITQALKWLVRTISDLETNVVSVERVQEYAELKTEAPRVTHLRPRLTWPSHGNIIFTNYSTRYRPGLDLVLKGLDLNIRGGEKVGIVGRTGAGKSSLTLALFRLIEPASGNVTIDGVDTISIGLHDLRSRLTILPQDPVLFSGSLRMNLDPFGQFSDRELWNALQHAHLLQFVRDLPEGLDYDCGEEGRNLSVGQRQLVCLARGLLRKTRILVLDEPTAAVDMETDILIQGTIRRDFADCTTLTIAHRLNTIMDYDRIVVLDEGRVKEFDKPNNLLANKDSIFYSLAMDAGLV